MKKPYEQFDAVVIGSGFGGAVIAYRLAEAKLKVCILERGRPYPPGSFPRTPWAMRRNVWDPSEGLYGLFDIWSFRGIESIVSSGLGGGSLIYANVLLRKDEKWFVQEDLTKGGYEHWPVSRRDLDPHYDAVEKMLKPQRFPYQIGFYEGVIKTAALKLAAERLNLSWELVPLAVTFGKDPDRPRPGEMIEEKHRNLHDAIRLSCKLCGECDIGCNYGSKNTLDLNYLSEAKRHGAEIRTLCEARSLEPSDGGGYLVEYVQHDLEYTGVRRDTSSLPRKTLAASQVILSAGTLGSTYLLLKNRNRLTNLSPKLGSRFSGNGDLLTFAVCCRDDKDRQSLKPRFLDPTLGPVITSTIRLADKLDGIGGAGRGGYIQDAGYTQIVEWILEMADTPGRWWRMLLFAARYLAGLLRIDTDSNLSYELSTLLRGADFSRTSLPLLGMGRDLPIGQMYLSGRWLEIDSSARASRRVFQRLRQQMRRIAQVWKGRFYDNPLWYLMRTITVHPLGGCPMGVSSSTGVVDAYGEAFEYPGLFVADGSVMPGPVGVNPSLTIAALADRFADRAIARHRRQHHPPAVTGG